MPWAEMLGESVWWSTLSIGQPGTMSNIRRFLPCSLSRDKAGWHQKPHQAATRRGRGTFWRRPSFIRSRVRSDARCCGGVTLFGSHTQDNAPRRNRLAQG
jgi:hypothetical protein